MSSGGSKKRGLSDLMASVEATAKKRQELEAAAMAASGAALHHMGGAAGDAGAADEAAVMQRVHHWLANAVATRAGDCSRLECELRLGEAQAESFVSGVTQADFAMLRDALRQRGDCTESDETWHFYAPAALGLPGSDSVRVRVDPESGAVLAAERKERLDTFTTTVAHLPYDMRVALANEEPLDAASVALPAEAGAGLRSVRRKQRCSLEEPTGNGAAPLWRVDLTEVTTTHDGEPEQDGRGAAAGQTTFEFEIELLDAARNAPAWAESDPAPLQSALTRCWHLLTSVLGVLRGVESPLDGVPLDIVRDEFELTALRQTAVEWVPNFSNESVFPGPMPIAFSRRYMGVIQTSDYMVSEKSDGLRYMMLVNSSGVYLFDRRFDFYLVLGLDVLTELFASNEVTILDGELVRHRLTERPVFLVFDAVVIDGAPIGPKNLHERLAAVRDRIVMPYRQAVGQGRLDERALPFTIIGKSFYRKKDIGKLFNERIKKDGSVRYYADDKRNHKTDGLIFTPVEGGYRPPHDLPILKWKYGDLLSVDFKMAYDHRAMKWVLRATGDNSTDVTVRDVELMPEDNARLQDDMTRIESPSPDGSVVVELTYNVWTGRWAYHGLRPDKTSGNHIRTVFDTLEVASENITEQELCYRVVRKPADDHWQQKMTDAMSHITKAAANGGAARRP